MHYLKHNPLLIFSLSLGLCFELSIDKVLVENRQQIHDIQGTYGSQLKHLILSVCPRSKAKNIQHFLIFSSNLLLR